MTFEVSSSTFSGLPITSALKSKVAFSTTVLNVTVSVSKSSSVIETALGATTNLCVLANGAYSSFPACFTVISVSPEPTMLITLSASIVATVLSLLAKVKSESLAFSSGSTVIWKHSSP